MGYGGGGGILAFPAFFYSVNITTSHVVILEMNGGVDKKKATRAEAEWLCDSRADDDVKAC